MISKETRQAIARDYEKLNYSINLLVPKYGVSRGTVRNILKELNVPRRQGTRAMTGRKMAWNALTADPEIGQEYRNAREKNRNPKAHSEGRRAHYDSLRLPPEKAERTRDMYLDGMSTKEIAEDQSCHPNTIRARLKAMGVERRTRSESAFISHQSGSRKPRKKRETAPEPEISWETVLEMKKAELEQEEEIRSKQIDMDTLVSAICAPSDPSATSDQPLPDSNEAFVQSTHFEAVLYKDHNPGDPSRRYPNSLNQKRVFKYIFRAPGPVTINNIGSHLDDFPGNYSLPNIRRFIGQLSDAGLIKTVTGPQPGDPPGRPPNRYTITDKGKELAVKVGYKKSDHDS